MISNEELMAKVKEVKGRTHYREVLDIAIESDSPTNAANKVERLGYKELYTQDARWIAMAIKRGLVTAEGLLDELFQKLENRGPDAAPVQNQEKSGDNTMAEDVAECVMVAEKEPGKDSGGPPVIHGRVSLTIHDIQIKLNKLSYVIKDELIKARAKLPYEKVELKKLIDDCERSLCFIQSFEEFAERVLKNVSDVKFTLMSHGPDGGDLYLLWRNSTTKENVCTQWSLRARACVITRSEPDGFQKTFRFSGVQRIFYESHSVSGLNEPSINVEANKYMYKLGFHSFNELLESR